MSFDRIKAMRNAERYLSQGKIREAISEYRSVVENDPRDVVTMNMLGDLYSKASDNRAAAHCYRSVADYYGSQGFAQKAIAVYNKLARIQPNSLEVSQKLAELYKAKGAYNEAKSHYALLAEHYSKQGRRTEALEIWNEIANLDQNNLTVYLTIADEYLQEERLDDAADAFCSAGCRLLRVGRHADALEAFEKALAINASHQGALKGIVDTHFAESGAEEAIAFIEARLNDDPNNRNLRIALIDAFIRDRGAASAEKELLILVQLDPSAYAKCVDVAELYYSLNDIEGAARVVTIASEHMLAGGESERLHEILERLDNAEPGRLDVVRLLARFCSWRKDNAELKRNLKRLAEIAGREGSTDDERLALSQLVMIMPQETVFAARLSEINEELGYSENDHVASTLFNSDFINELHASEVTVVDASAEPDGPAITDFEVESFPSASDEPVVAAEIAYDSTSLPSMMPNGNENHWSDGNSPELQKEIATVMFYVENGYQDLAVKAIDELRGRFGDRPELVEIVSMLNGGADKASPDTKPEPTNDTFDLDDLRVELGLDDTVNDEDFETHYQTAIAYKEMGLTEQAIREFQDAIALVSANDGTRRFFNCANMLGHCFIEIGKPNLAVKWHLRSLESFEITDEERQGVWYELGVAYDADGDPRNASKYFEQVYSENIDFRDIGERIRNLAITI